MSGGPDPREVWAALDAAGQVLTKLVSLIDRGWKRLLRMVGVDA